MCPLTQQLISAIEELAQFMEGHGYEDWNEILRSTAKKISLGDFRSVEGMSSWWGTYGTLNDVVIRKFSPNESFESANREFHALSGNVSSLRGEVIKNAVFE